MYSSRFRIAVNRLRPAPRLVMLVSLLVTVVAACGKGTGGGPGY